MNVHLLIFLLMFFKLNSARYRGYREIVKPGKPEVSKLRQLLNDLKFSLINDDYDSEELEETSIENDLPHYKLNEVFDKILNIDNIEIANKGSPVILEDNEPNTDEMSKLAVSIATTGS